MRRGPRSFSIPAVLVALLAAADPPQASAAPKPARPSKPSADRQALLIDTGVSGDWEDEDEAMRNRADIEVAAFGASLRAMAIDRRRVEDIPLSGGETALALGAYHAPTASRILFGALESTGLSRRVSSPFGRAIPFPDDRAAGRTDLDPDADPDDPKSFHAAIGTSRRRPFRARASVVMESEDTYVAAAATEVSGGRGSFIRAEGAYARRDLGERRADAWFSDRSPLPVRPLRVYAGSAMLSSPSAAVACDGALSEAFAQGAGAYGNAALRLGDAPWRLFFAAEASTAAYIGPDGDTVGLGFRTASRIERLSRTNRGSYCRADFKTAHPFAEAPPEAFEASVSLRRGGEDFFRLRRTAVSGEWTVSPERPLIDAAQWDAGASVGPVDLSARLRTTFEPSDDGRGGRLWDSVVARGAIDTRIGPIALHAGAGRTILSRGGDGTEATFGAALNLRRAAFGCRFDFEEIPARPSMRFFWRVRRRTALSFPSGDTP